MTHPTRLVGREIYLRRLTEADVTQRYVNWLNDPEVNKFMESRFVVWTLQSLTCYLQEHMNERNYFFAICLEDHRHVGNIKLGPINRHHLTGDIGLMIGEKNAWGRDLGTEAIRLLKEFAFSQLELIKLTAGVYATNLAS